MNKAAEACGPTIAAAVATVRIQGIAVMQWDNVANPNLDIAKVSGNAQFTLARERTPNSGHWEDLGFKGVADCEMLNDPDVKIWACATRVAPDRSFRENL